MLLNAAVYHQGHKLADIVPERIDAHLGIPDQFVWVALKDAPTADIDRMGEVFGIHPLVVEDARHGHQRPKIEEYPDQLFAVMHLVHMNEDGTLRIGELDVCAGRDFVLSVRTQSEGDFLGVRQRCEQEPELLRFGPGFVLYALMDAVVDRYFPVIDRLQNQLEELEDGMFTRKDAARDTLQQLYALKRSLMQVQHAVAPLIEALEKLHGGRTPALCTGLEPYFVDVHDHLERINHHIDNIRDMADTAMQVTLSLISLDDSAVTKKLAAWGALFAIPTMIAGLYGMNFHNMPELDWPLGYPMAVGLMAAADLLLWRRFKQAGWL